MFRELATFRKQCAGGALAAAGALGGFLFGALGGNLFGALGRGLLGGGGTFTGAAVYLSGTIHCGWNLVLLRKDCVSEVPCSRNLINHSECSKTISLYFFKKTCTFVKVGFFFLPVRSEGFCSRKQLVWSLKVRLRFEED